MRIFIVRIIINSQIFKTFIFFMKTYLYIFKIKNKIVFVINLIICKFYNNNLTSDIDKFETFLLFEFNIIITIFVIFILFFYSYNNVEIIIF